MKKLSCFKCNAYLGNIEKGRIKKDASIVCAKCIDAYKTNERLAAMKFSNDKSNPFSSIFG